MSLINCTIRDNQNSTQIPLKLSPDKAINPFTWVAPIKWSGSIANYNVNFVQTSNQAFAKSCFDWSGFPIEFEHLQNEIVELIEKELRIMN